MCTKYRIICHPPMLTTYHRSHKRLRRLFFYTQFSSPRPYDFRPLRFEIKRGEKKGANGELNSGALTICCIERVAFATARSIVWQPTHTSRWLLFGFDSLFIAASHRVRPVNKAPQIERSITHTRVHRERYRNIHVVVGRLMSMPTSALEQLSIIYTTKNDNVPLMPQSDTRKHVLL